MYRGEVVSLVDAGPPPTAKTSDCSWPPGAGRQLHGDRAGLVTEPPSSLEDDLGERGPAPQAGVPEPLPQGRWRRLVAVAAIPVLSIVLALIAACRCSSSCPARPPRVDRLDSAAHRIRGSSSGRSWRADRDHEHLRRNRTLILTASWLAWGSRRVSSISAAPVRCWSAVSWRQWWAQHLPIPRHGLLPGGGHRRVSRRRLLRVHPRFPQGVHRCPRGGHHDHAQFDRAFPHLSAGQRRAPCPRLQLPPAPPTWGMPPCRTSAAGHSTSGC